MTGFQLLDIFFQSMFLKQSKKAMATYEEGGGIVKHDSLHSCPGATDECECLYMDVY